MAISIDWPLISQTLLTTLHGSFSLEQSNFLVFHREKWNLASELSSRANKLLFLCYISWPTSGNGSLSSTSVTTTTGKRRDELEWALTSPGQSNGSPKGERRRRESGAQLEFCIRVEKSLCYYCLRLQQSLAKKQHHYRLYLSWAKLAFSP